MDVCELIEGEAVRAKRERNKMLGRGGGFREGFMEEVAFEQDFLPGSQVGTLAPWGTAAMDGSMDGPWGDFGPVRAGQK